MQKKIVNGSPIEIEDDVFNRAEEAYSAARSNDGPKVIQYFSTISLPIIAIVVLTFLATLFI